MKDRNLKYGVLCLAIVVFITLGLILLNERLKRDAYIGSFELNLETVLYDVYDNPVKISSLYDRLLFVFNPHTCAPCVVEQMNEIRRYVADFTPIDLIIVGYFDNRRDLRRFRMNNIVPGVTYYRATDRILMDELSRISSTSYFLKISYNSVVFLRETTRRRNETYNFLRNYFNN